MSTTSAEGLNWPPPTTAIVGFDVEAINAETADHSHVDAGVFEQRFMVLARASEGKLAFGWFWLSGAVGLLLRPADQGSPWGPRYVSDGWRMPAIEDFLPQAEAFETLAAQLDHPGLKARLADIAWTNERHRGAAGRCAIDAYVDSLDRLLDGRARPRYGEAEGASFEALGFAQRALQLALRLTGKKKTDPSARDAFLRLYRRAVTDRAVTVFGSAAELARYYDLVPALDVAADLVAVARDAPDRFDPLASAQLLGHAAHLHLQAQDQDASKRCQVERVCAILKMVDQVSTSGAKAHWVQSALHALRGIRGQDEWRRSLRRDLRDLQEDALSEFVMMTVPLDLGEERREAFKTFAQLDLPAALKALACIGRSQPVESLREDALASLDQFPLGAMMGTRHSDEDGRTAANTPSGDREDPDEEWLKQRINESERIRRQIIVQGSFDPARLTISQRHNIHGRHLAAIVSRSPFVRWEQQGLMALGFTRLLQGDDQSAVHLLVPQLEPCLRHVLRVAGHDPVVDFDDMTEENVSLSAMLGRLRPQLEAILPPATVLELELLFDFRAGSALRHAVAHGRIGTGGCHTTEAVYACWLLYQLTCWPLLRTWDSITAQAIRDQC